MCLINEHVVKENIKFDIENLIFMEYPKGTYDRGYVIEDLTDFMYQIDEIIEKNLKNEK